MQPGPERDYFAGVLANRTGHSEDSIHLLNSALPKLRESQPVRAAIALEALADDYTEIFRYGDASRAYDDLLTHLPNTASGYRPRTSAIVHLLQTSPAQTITMARTGAAKDGTQPDWFTQYGADSQRCSRTVGARHRFNHLPGEPELCTTARTQAVTWLCANGGGRDWN